ncbi:Uncharacterised protein [Mycobacteroides abscessus subsp. bolletii]|nr:Uncharacterised protein [Mycobacteroides abscessus subsp. bolletii]
MGEDSATKTGTTTTETPTVSPSRNRAAARVFRSTARAESNEKMPNVAATKTIDRLRPILLDSGPPMRAPKISPITTAVAATC